jgi:hypothetical protein
MYLIKKTYHLTMTKSGRNNALSWSSFDNNKSKYRVHWKTWSSEPLDSALAASIRACSQSKASQLPLELQIKLPAGAASPARGTYATSREGQQPTSRCLAELGATPLDEAPGADTARAGVR